jgi:glutaredoxin-like YruB-family protein
MYSNQGFNAMAQLSVTVYTATWCAFCHAAKDYFDKLGVKYEDRDVESKPEWAVEAVTKSGQRGIPVIDIDGEIIVGFDRPKIDAALAKA